MASRAVSYDFRRPDRIATEQLRALHLVHENFARNLAPSLSAYLRIPVAVTLISVQQLSFEEFTRSLPSLTSLISMGLKPYDGNAVLEINPSLAFPILEMLLGGSGTVGTHPSREITEIEQSVLDGLLRVILNDLRNAWGTAPGIDFSIESHETEPLLLQTLAPGETVAAVRMELRIGDAVGTMNIGIPPAIVTMLRQKVDRKLTIRKTPATEDEPARILRLIRPALLHLDARLQGPKIDVDTLLNLKEGDILIFDYPVERPVDIMVNGRLKYQGEIVTRGRKRAFEVREPVVGR